MLYMTIVALSCRMEKHGKCLIAVVQKSPPDLSGIDFKISSCWL